MTRECQTYDPQTGVARLFVKRSDGRHWMVWSSVSQSLVVLIVQEPGCTIELAPGAGPLAAQQLEQVLAGGDPWQ